MGVGHHSFSFSACRLLSTKPLTKPVLTYQLDPKEKRQWNFNPRTLRNKLHWNFNPMNWNCIESVSKMSAILSSPQSVSCKHHEFQINCFNFLVQNKCENSNLDFPPFSLTRCSLDDVELMLEMCFSNQIYELISLLLPVVRATKLNW